MNNFYHQILKEVQQSCDLRVPLLKKISNHFENRFVIAFYTNFYSEGGIITDEDVEMLQNILLTRQVSKKKVLLIINSPGGDPLAAERFVKVLKEFSENDYWVLIPHMAKSAATVIALGASKICMFPSSELGPIDIQVSWEGELRPAYSILDAYETLLNKGIALKKEERIEPILQQLSVFDPTYVEWLKRVRELSKDIVIKILKNGAFASKSKKEIERALKQFIDPKETKTHGRPIYYSDINSKLKTLFYLIEDNGIIKTVMEFHTRIKCQMLSQKIDKLLETEEGQYVAKR